MKDKRLLMGARHARDASHALISGGFNGRAIVEIVKSLDKVIAYLEGEEE